MEPLLLHRLLMDRFPPAYLAHCLRKDLLIKRSKSLLGLMLMKHCSLLINPIPIIVSSSMDCNELSRIFSHRFWTTSQTLSIRRNLMEASRIPVTLIGQNSRSPRPHSSAIRISCRKHSEHSEIHMAIGSASHQHTTVKTFHTRI